MCVLWENPMGQEGRSYPTSLPPGAKVKPFVACLPPPMPWASPGLSHLAWGQQLKSPSILGVGLDIGMGRIRTGHVHPHEDWGEGKVAANPIPHWQCHDSNSGDNSWGKPPTRCNLGTYHVLAWRLQYPWGSTIIMALAGSLREEEIPDSPSLPQPGAMVRLLKRRGHCYWW